MKWNEFRFDKNFIRCLDASPFDQRSLANALGKDETTVSKWAAGKNIPPVETIFHIADLFKVHPRALLFDEYEPMDDEEMDNAKAWRKMTEGERRAFTTLFKEMTTARTELLKKIPVRRERTAAAPIQLPSLQLPLKELLALQKLMTLRLSIAPEHLESGESRLLAHVATKVDRQVVALMSAETKGKPVASEEIAANGVSAHGKPE